MIHQLILIIILYFLVAALIASYIKSSVSQTMKTDEENNFNILRMVMVNNQLKNSFDMRPPVTDQNVLNAMLKVPRHKFVSKEMQRDAYLDMPLPIGLGQTISQPYMVALMTQCLELKGNEKVLEIGTGCGYQTAIIAEIVKAKESEKNGGNVYTIEIVEPLYKQTTKTMLELGYTNVKTKLGDGFVGWEEYAPFDRIILTCSVTLIPEPLLNQLKDNGLIVLPIGPTFSESMLTVVRKQDGKPNSTPIIPCRFVPMTGKMQE